jgi:membrane associated rhomboid family serine protease
MTLIFLTIQTIVFVLMQTGLFGDPNSPATILRFGGLFGLQIIEQPSTAWHLLTPIFVHIGFSHFLFNSITLYFLGRQTEQIFGHFNFILIYLGSGIFGNCLSFFAHPEFVSAGASTSLFGLFASFVALRFFLKDNVMIKQLAQSYAILIVLNLVFNLMDTTIDMYGHIGGLIGGFLLTIVVGVPHFQARFKKNHRFAAGAIYLGLIVIILYLTFSKFNV